MWSCIALVQALILISMSIATAQPISLLVSQARDSFLLVAPAFIRSATEVPSPKTVQPNRPSENAQILRQAEKIILDHDGIVLRVAGIYGPGRSFLLRSVMNGTSVISDHFVNQVHRDDVASAISFLARSRAVDLPRIFNVVDDTPAPRSEILDWLSTRVGLPLSSSPATAAPKRGHSNKRVSNAKLRALGWVPAYPSYREGFDRSVLPALEGGEPPP